LLAFAMDRWNEERGKSEKERATPERYEKVE
jgi:hypothetical protein